MRVEADYGARSAFLYYTTKIMNPAPVDTLLELLPTFRSWRAHVENEHRPADQDAPVTGERVSALFGLATRAISPLDDSAEAVALKDALAGWMTRHRFRDQWLADAGLCTLLQRDANGVAHPRKWYLQPPYEDLCPEVKIYLRQEFGEARQDFLKRFEREYLQRRKEYNASMQFRTGELGDRLRPARLTAFNFAGWTFAAIARHENLDRGYVRKTVVNFADRAGLTVLGKRVQPIMLPLQ
jgi:hypothetical protein